MNNEYVVINKTELLKVMENNKKEAPHHDGIYVSEAQDARVELIEEILSQSTPLISEIKKAFDEGFHKGYNVGQGDAKSHPLALTIANNIHNDRNNYIKNLKLDI